METKELRVYKLLNEIAKSCSQSQRGLSKKLKMSLGLVNSSINQLYRKELIEISTAEKNRTYYTLTKKGDAEKKRLEYKYFHNMFKSYRHIRRTIRKLLYDIKNKKANKVALFGAGELAEITFISVQEAGLETVVVVDDRQIGGSFFNHTIKSSKDLLHVQYDYILLTGIDMENSRIEILSSFGIPEQKIMRLL